MRVLDTRRMTDDPARSIGADKSSTARRLVGGLCVAAGATGLFGCSQPLRQLDPLTEDPVRPTCTVETDSQARESVHEICNSSTFTKYVRTGDDFQCPLLPGYTVSVGSIERSEDAEGLWTGNIVQVSVYAQDGGLVAEGQMRSNLGESLELPGNKRVVVGWAMAEPSDAYTDNEPKAEIIVVDGNPAEALVTETVSVRTSSGDDSCEYGEEQVQEIAVDFPGGLYPFATEGYRNLNLGIIDDATIVNVEIPEEGSEEPTRVVLGSLLGVEMLGLGERLDLGGFFLEVGDVGACESSNRIWALVRIRGSAGQTLVRAEDPESEQPNIALSGKASADFIDTSDGSRYQTYFSATTDGPDTVMLHTTALQVTGEIFDGQTLTVGGTDYLVSIGLNASRDAISRITFTAVPPRLD